MHKLIRLLFLGALTVMTVGRVFASTGSLTARIEQPKSPTGINDIKINVVTLDIEGRAVSVQCYKKSPSDGGFSSLGSVITLTPNGGNNTAHCDATGILGGDGIYNFYAVVSAGSDSITTDTVSVDYRTAKPGTPVNYSKNQSGSCTFNISFRTADDAGKTVKVQIYRGDSTNFVLDSGTLIGTINIGSNTDGTFSNTPPDCNKTYYYELRAFDSYGNGSDVVGDTIKTQTTTTQTTGATGASSGAVQGAIAAGTAGNVLGEATEATGPTGGATGQSATISASPSPSAAEKPTGTPAQGAWYMSPKTYIFAGAGILLVIIALFAL